MELCDLGAVEMRRLIGGKRLSPVELLESCLSRIERANPRLNAFVTLAAERARQEAKAAEAAVARGDALPLLHGLPIGIKDLEETEGIRTTWGSPLYADHVPAQDEGVVAAVRRAGAIVVGKTNVCPPSGRSPGPSPTPACCWPRWLGTTGRSVSCPATSRSATRTPTRSVRTSRPTSRRGSATVWRTSAGRTWSRPRSTTASILPSD